jgi:hypothetical protein
MLLPRRLVMLVASLMACPRASALVHGTRLATTHPAVTATKGVAPPQRPVATMRAPFDRSADAMTVVFGSVQKHYLEPFVAGVIIRGLFELLAEIEGRPSRGPQQWWPAALRSGGAKWWPQVTRIPARWTCVAACVSLADDYMFGAVGLVLGFLGSGRLMVMQRRCR